MNFYSFHLGDYAKRTKHLSLMEDLAYRRMMDLYYTTEGPLPLEPEKIARLIGMRDQIKDVCEILSDFFVKSEIGWVNKRCEEEIEAYLKKANRARAANKARWNAKSDLTSDVKSDLISDADQIPTNPNPNPNPNPKKSFSPKKNKTVFPDDFELTEERKTKAETYWQKHGVALDAQRVWDNFQASHKAKGSRMIDWESAWETWYVKAIDYARTGANGNGKPLQAGCVMRVQLEEFRFGDCGKPSAGEVRGKMLCKEHLKEAMVKA